MRPIVNVQEENGATDIGIMHKKLVKIARVVPAIFSPPDRQTHRQTYSSQYFEVIKIPKNTIKIPKNTIYRRVAEFVTTLCTFMHMYF